MKWRWGIFAIIALIIAGILTLTLVNKRSDTAPITSVIIPSAVEDNCMGFLVGEPNEIYLVNKIGAGWINPHPGPFAWEDIEPTKGSFSFSESDKWVKEAQKNNITIMGTIWPYAYWDQTTCHLAKDCQAKTLWQIPDYLCKPCNMTAYENFLTNLVERYDGDSYLDMPGLKIPVLYWEISTEPDLSSSTLNFFKGNETEYVEILNSSYTTIKTACQDCKIVQGGAAGIETSFLSFWKKVFDLGGGDYFDIANVHFIGAGDITNLNVKVFKATMNSKGVNKPLWMASADYDTSVSDQAVENSAAGAFSEGAEKVFFSKFDLKGNYGIPPGDNYSKVYDKITAKC